MRKWIRGIGSSVAVLFVVLLSYTLLDGQAERQVAEKLKSLDDVAADLRSGDISTWQAVEKLGAPTKISADTRKDEQATIVMEYNYEIRSFPFMPPRLVSLSIVVEASDVRLRNAGTARSW